MIRRNHSAFSFIEVLMVVFILAICGLPPMGYIHGNTRATAHTQDRSLGMTLVGQTMERFRSLGYDDLMTRCGASPISEPELVDDPLLKLENFPHDLRKRILTDNYVRTVTFKDVPDPRLASSGSTTARVGLLTVTVEWKPQNLPATKTVLSKIITRL